MADTDTKQTALDLLRLMLGTDVSTDSKDTRPVRWLFSRAIENAFATEDFSDLLGTLSAPDSENTRALHQRTFEAACAEGNVGAVSALLGSGTNMDTNKLVEIDGTYLTVIQHAVQRNDVALVRILAADGRVDVNKNSKVTIPPLSTAAMDGRLACLLALFAAPTFDVGANNGHNQAVVLAAYGGHHQCLRALLAVDGIDPNAEDGDGDTALMCAAEQNQPACLQALLAHADIDVNHCGTVRAGSTALNLACTNRHWECAELLIAAKGVDVNVRDDVGHTALRNATCAMDDLLIDPLSKGGVDTGRGRGTDAGTSTVRALVAVEGVDVNTATHHGSTALHIASAKGQTGAVRALLLGGGCRFMLTSNTFYANELGVPGDGSPFGAATSEEVRELFLSGIDYWQLRHHAHHSWAMRQVVCTLFLVEQRLDTMASVRARAPLALQSSAPTLPPLPEEMWRVLCGFLRSADF